MLSMEVVSKKKSDTKPNPEMVSMEEVAKKNLTPNLTRKWLVWKRLLKKNLTPNLTRKWLVWKRLLKKKNLTPNVTVLDGGRLITRDPTNHPPTSPTKSFTESSMYGPRHISTARITLHLTPKHSDVLL